MVCADDDDDDDGMQLNPYKHFFTTGAKPYVCVSDMSSSPSVKPGHTPLR